MPKIRVFLMRASVFLALVACLTWIAYAPGMASPFLLDDSSNLSILGSAGAIDNIPALLRYVTAGTADPTGRPLTLLSFLVDARNWPADPRPFKRTNILLHLINGILLAWLLFQLGRKSGAETAVAWKAAVLAAGMWLLHPLFVSTTLYVIQREAMLPATFILASLIAYLRFRERAAQGDSKALWLAGATLLCGTGLATLCKANGALLPLFALLIEVFLCRRTDRSPTQDFRHGLMRVRWLCMILPTLLVLLFLAKVTWSEASRGIPPGRDWSVAERLLTEFRVVVDYLGLIWLPRPYSNGLFNDGFIVSRSLLDPLSTSLSALLVALMVAVAVAIRRRVPAVALCLLFFFAGHLMESTTLPLELYFEHRNYVPAMLMFWPLALLIWGGANPPLYSSASRRARAAPNNAIPSTPAPPLQLLRLTISAVLLVSLATLTRSSALLWARPREQAELWARINPESPRAQAYAAQLELGDGDPRGIDRLDSALARHPDDILLALNFLGARCATGVIRTDDLDRAAFALRTSKTIGRLGYEWFNDGLAAVREGTCNGLNVASLSLLVDAAANNATGKLITDRRQDLENLKGNIAVAASDPVSALASFNAAIDVAPEPAVALTQAATLARAGYQRAALDHLAHFERNWRPLSGMNFNMQSIHRWVLWKQGYWQHEIEHLRTQLESDLSTSGDQSRIAPAAEVR